MTDPAGTMMLTIFLKHQQDKNLAEINAKLKTTEFLEGLSAQWRRTRQLVRNDGYRLSRHLAISCKSTTRGQFCDGTTCMGCLRNRILRNG